MAVTTVTVQGQVTIPKSVRERLHLEAGSRVEFLVDQTGEVIVRPLSRRVDEVFGRLSEDGGRAPLTVEEREAAVRERMKGVDSNLLVRFLVNDDQRQAATVHRLLQRCEAEKRSLFVPLPPVLEPLWVLEGAYGVGREELIASQEDLLAMPVFGFDRQPAVRAFPLAARRSNGALSDLLIAQVAVDAGCETLLTLDRGAARHEPFEQLQGYCSR